VIPPAPLERCAQDSNKSHKSTEMSSEKSWVLSQPTENTVSQPAEDGRAESCESVGKLEIADFQTSGLHSVRDVSLGLNSVRAESSVLHFVRGCVLAVAVGWFFVSVVFCVRRGGEVGGAVKHSRVDQFN